MDLVGLSPLSLPLNLWLPSITTTYKNSLNNKLPLVIPPLSVATEDMLSMLSITPPKRESN